MHKYTFLHAIHVITLYQLSKKPTCFLVYCIQTILANCNPLLCRLAILKDIQAHNYYVKVLKPMFQTKCRVEILYHVLFSQGFPLKSKYKNYRAVKTFSIDIK